MRAPMGEKSWAHPEGPGPLGQCFAQGPDAEEVLQAQGGNQAQGLSPQDTRLSQTEPFFLQPLLRTAQAGPSVPRHAKRAQPMLSLCCVLQEKCQSPSVPAETCCCKELLQVLRDNRALMRLSLRHSSLQRHRQKRPAKGGLWKRRRAALLPSALNSPTPAHLLALTGDV